MLATFMKYIEWNEIEENKISSTGHYSTNLQFITDRDINYFVENNKNTLLDALLTSYNLFGDVYFPTRFQINSAIANDNIFIPTVKF